MNTAKLLRFLRILLGFVVVFGLTACAYDPYYSEPYHSYPDNYHHPHDYDYYYYPTIGVYFHYSTGDYYYRSKKRWARSKHLPPHFRLDHRDRVIIRTQRDKPYAKHDDHKRKFKPHRDYRRDKNIDRKERDYNQKSHKQYRKKRDGSREKRQDDRKKSR